MSPSVGCFGRQAHPTSPFAGPWSGPEFVKQLQEIMSVIHFLYLLEQEKPMAVVGGL